MVSVVEERVFVERQVLAALRIVVRYECSDDNVIVVVAS